MYKNDEDLSINRCAVVKVIDSGSNGNNVFKINISFYVTPKIQCKVEEYEMKTDKLKKYISRSLKKYVYSNKGLLNHNSIIDINFTSANLKEGDNKSFQLSWFLKPNMKCSYNRFKDKISSTIKPTIKLIRLAATTNAINPNKNNIKDRLVIKPVHSCFRFN